MSEIVMYRLPEIIGSKKKGIAGIIPMSAAAWYRGVKDGRYPKPVKLSAKSVAWTSTDIVKLIERLARGEWQAVA